MNAFSLSPADSAAMPDGANAQSAAAKMPPGVRDNMSVMSATNLDHAVPTWPLPSILSIVGG
jgi:hypothetical protein